MAIEAGDVMVKFGGDTTGLDKSLRDADGKIKKSTNNWQARMKKVGMVMVGAAVAIGGVALKTAVDFETAFAGVRKTVDATEEEFRELDKALKDMTKELPVTYVELAGIAEAAGQLGIAKEDIIDFTETIAKLGMATDLTGQEAATMLARFLGITGTSTKDIERLSSVIVDLGNNSRGTESEILNMAMRLAGAGTAVGLTVVEIMAFSSALVGMGLKAEAGGTAFSKTMLEMNSAVAGSGVELEAFATAAGMTVGDFSTLFKTDATGAIMSFISGLGDMKSAGEDITPVLDAVGLGGIRVVDSLLRATGAQQDLTDALIRGEIAWEENAALQDEAAKRIETTASKMAILKNEMALTAAALGKALIPILTNLMEKVTPIVTKIGEWIEKNPKLATGILIAVGAIGAVLIIAVPLINAIKTLAIVTKLVTVAQWLWNAAMTANPIGLIIAAIAGLVVGIIFLVKNWDKVVEFFRNAWVKIKRFFLSGVEKILGILAKFTRFLPGVGDAVAKLHDQVANMIDAEKIGTNVDRAAANLAKFTDKVNETSDDIVTDVETTTQSAISGAQSVADEEKRILETRAQLYRDLTAERLGLIDEQMIAELIAMDPTGEVARLAEEHNKLLGDIKEDGAARDIGLEEDRVDELKDALKNEYRDRKNELEDQLEDAEGARKDSIEDQLAELKDGKKAREDVIKDQIADIEEGWAREESSKELHNAIMELDTEGYFAAQKTAVAEGLTDQIETYALELEAFQALNTDKLVDAEAFVEEYNRIMAGLGATPGHEFEPVNRGPLPPLPPRAMASGGLVTRPTLAMLGENYQPELVVPLSNMRNVLGQGNTTNQFNISQLVVREEADIRRIAQELYRMQESKVRALGV